MCLLQTITSFFELQRNFIAMETGEKAANRRSVDKAYKKRALETEGEALERKSRNRVCVAKKRVLVCVDLPSLLKKCSIRAKK